MSKIVGVDYGRKKIGLAVAESNLATPLKVINVDSMEDAVKKVSRVVKAEEAEKIAIGISEGNMAKETRKFGVKLKEESGTPVIYQDETLSSKDAKKLSIEAGINRTKRKDMEHAYSAAIILQGYLDRVGP